MTARQVHPVRSASRTDEVPDEGVGLRFGPVAFWAMFVAGWGAYLTLFILAERLRAGVSWSVAIQLGSVGVLLAAIPAALLAAGRSRLYDLRCTPFTFVVRLVGLGIAYAVVTGVTSHVVMMGFMKRIGVDYPDFPEGGVGSWIFNATFLYILLAIFLVGSEAVNRLHESRTRAARESVLRAEAEAKAVRAQFNPHFVFNTLHSLMLLVRADPDTAEQAIENVAELIRYGSTLERRQVDQVTLARELDFARRYLALEKLRLADRLQVEWVVAGGLEDVLVPAFGLQTLLENAIKHGIAPLESGGRIRITVHREDGLLSVQVADDGLGADPAEVSVDGWDGLGLLARRLDTTHGADATLEWDAAPGDGFVATFRVPVTYDAGSEVPGDRTRPGASSPVSAA